MHRKYKTHSVKLLDDVGHCFLAKVLLVSSYICYKYPMSRNYSHPCPLMSRKSLPETTTISQTSNWDRIRTHKHLIGEWIPKHHGLNVCGFKSHPSHQFQCHLLSIRQCQAWFQKLSSRAIITSRGVQHTLT